MRLYQIPEATGINSLTITEAPDPAPGPGQVLVRMHAASLNYRDLVVVKGGYGKGQRLPLVPLSDGAGEVVGVGDGVTRVKVGDCVAGIFMQGWLHGRITAAFGTMSTSGAPPVSRRSLPTMPPRRRADGLSSQSSTGRDSADA